jgi:hypothetical protein
VASGKPNDVSMQRQKTEVAVVAEIEFNIMAETDWNVIDVSLWVNYKIFIISKYYL